MTEQAQEGVWDQAEATAARTITDPPEELIRVVIEPQQSWTQAVNYFESQTEALRWLAERREVTTTGTGAAPLKILSIHRLGFGLGVASPMAGRRWWPMQYVPPSALGTLAPKPEQDKA
jgi:hypothetical protein